MYLCTRNWKSNKIMTKQVKINVNVEITFEYSEKSGGIDNAIQSAVALAIEPNFHTIENGVHLVNVQTAEPEIAEC